MMTKVDRSMCRISEARTTDLSQKLEINHFLPFFGFQTSEKSRKARVDEQRRRQAGKETEKRAENTQKPREEMNRFIFRYNDKVWRLVVCCFSVCDNNGKHQLILRDKNGREKKNSIENVLVAAVYFENRITGR